MVAETTFEAGPQYSHTTPTLSQDHREQQRRRRRGKPPAWPLLRVRCFEEEASAASAAPFASRPPSSMCGILAALLGDTDTHVNQLIVDGLTVLQHRGQGE